MRSITDNFRQLLKNKGMTRVDAKKFLLLVLGVGIASVLLIKIPFFSTVAPIFIIAVFGLFLLILWGVAGFVVFRSLLVASVGLSLIIFIGQSYCAPGVARVADDSLKILIGFGFIYTIAQFCRNLYRELFGDKKADEDWKRKGTIAVFKEMNEGKHSWLILVTYGLLVSMFVWQIYRVIVPIVDSLCVYK